MLEPTPLLVAYLGGWLATFAQRVQRYHAMPRGERETFKQIGRPGASFLIQATFWPLVAVIILAYGCASLVIGWQAP